MSLKAIEYECESERKGQEQNAPSILLAYLEKDDVVSPSNNKGGLRLFDKEIGVIIL